MILEELCSCVSHQARAQERADVEMIVAYPDIFPNFYVIPTPHLERERLFELREFALMGLARFRWLLVAIDQNTSGILDFFMGWREYRVHHHPTLDGSALRQYYRGGEFRQEFPTFVRAQLSKRAAVKAVLDYEYTLQHKLHDARTLPNGELVPPEVALSPEDVPVTKDRIVVFELGYDIQRVVDALKLQKKYVRSRGRHFYVTRPLSLSNAQVEEISDWMAHLLQLCHGRRSVKEIVPLLSVHLPEVESSLRAYVCMRLLQGARQQQLIEVYRLRAGSQEPPIGASFWDQEYLVAHNRAIYPFGAERTPVAHTSHVLSVMQAIRVIAYRSLGEGCSTNASRLERVGGVLFLVRAFIPCSPKRQLRCACGFMAFDTERMYDLGSIQRSTIAHKAGGACPLSIMLNRGEALGSV